MAEDRITKEPGYLYYVDKEGYISRVKMRRKGVPYVKNKQRISSFKINRMPGYLYYVDKMGRIGKAKMGGKKKAKKGAKK